MQGSYQQRQERERKDMEQAHMKIVKQMESRLYEMEGVNKVLCRIGSESSINGNVLLQKYAVDIDFMSIHIPMVHV